MEDFAEEVDVEELKNLLAESIAKQAAHNERVVEIRKQVAEIQKQFDTLNRERINLEREAQGLLSGQRELEKALEKAARLQMVKEQQEQLRREFEEKAKELDALTASAKWREFAFDHQIEGGKRLAIAKRGILADKRGLGKTLTSLVWADMVQGKKIIVIAPNDVVPQFEEEIRTWAPTRTIFSLRGLPKSQRDFVYPMLDMLDEWIITLNYEAWRRDKTIVDDLVSKGIDTMILDEAHRVKASDKITARGVFQIAYRPNYCSPCDKILNYMGPWVNAETGRITDRYCNYLSLCPTCGKELTNTVKNVLCMTGTPILNKPQELFSMLFLVDRGKFPSESKFLSDYCYQYGPNRWAFMSGGLPRLTKFMSEFFIQRTREDAGIHVPPPAIRVYDITKDLVKYKRQYEAEREITTRARLLMEEGERQRDIFFILDMILKERQCMTWPAGIRITDPDTKEFLCHFDVNESQKVDEATDLLMDLCEEEERIVVFSQFKAPLYEMYNRVTNAGYKAAMATGDQTDWEKQRIREDFDLKLQDPDRGYKFQVVFATYKAFGTGINLNAARHMILLDDEWNPGMEDQAIGRIDRMNSTNQANVHIFRVQNSIDNFMAALLEEKRKITEGFNESVSTAELLKFFKDE